jgi:hypothetical protein
VESLAEVHVSITGNTSDYVIEVASNGRLKSFVTPGLLGLIVGEGIMAHEFEKQLWKNISKAVDSDSAVKFKGKQHVFYYLHVTKSHESQTGCIIILTSLYKYY